MRMAKGACQPTNTSIIDIGFFSFFEEKCSSNSSMQNCSKYYTTIFLFFSLPRPSSSTSFLHQHHIVLAAFFAALLASYSKSPCWRIPTLFSSQLFFSSHFSPLSLFMLQFGTKHYLHSSQHWHTPLHNSPIKYE